MASIKEMVKNKFVKFTHYKEGELWYETTDGFAFPVPVDDVEGATMLSEDKAILYMRYIRKHLDMLEKAKAEQTN